MKVALQVIMITVPQIVNNAVINALLVQYLKQIVYYVRD